MSPTSYRTAPPRAAVKKVHSGGIRKLAGYILDGPVLSRGLGFLGLLTDLSVHKSKPLSRSDAEFDGSVRTIGA
jgi:hypothetical protein